MMRALLVAILVALPGCSVNEETRSALAAHPHVRSDGRLAADPAPLNLRDVARQPPGSPSRATYELLLWAQWGNTSGVLGLYDRAERADVIERDYADLWEVFLVSRPRIERVQQTGSTARVQVVLRTRHAAPRTAQLTLRTTGAGWVVVDETLRARAHDILAELLRGNAS
jgi:hypothetical protein